MINNVYTLLAAMLKTATLVKSYLNHGMQSMNSVHVEDPSYSPQFILRVTLTLESIIKQALNLILHFIV